MVTEEALAFRPRYAVTLECPLPAARDVYRNDFKTAESRDTFDELLGEATAVFELDGQRDGEWLRPSDYARAGHIAVSNCDLLIAIWDGQPGQEGGTGQTVREAMHQQVPVVRIDVNDPPSISVCALADHWDDKWQAALRESLLTALRPPKGALEWVRRYSKERIGAGAGDDTRSDLLATHYGKWYRASYWLKYGLSAFAVCFAVGGLLSNHGEAKLWPALELAAVLGILLCFMLARTRDWHERWLDYRLLAEQFRVLDFLKPLGETPPVFQPPKYWGVPSERHVCVRWYFQARLREYSLPHAIVTDEYVRQRRRDLLAVTRGQYKYNWEKHRSAKRRHEIMEWAGIRLFALTGLACIVHLFGWAPALILGAITAILPAFGAAMEGLQTQEESKRIAGYTLAMWRHLEIVETRIEDLQADAGLEGVRKIAVELATELTRETSGWHNLIHGQPPRV
jgi:hypothetical protein